MPDEGSPNVPCWREALALRCGQYDLLDTRPTRTTCLLVLVSSPLPRAMAPALVPTSSISDTVHFLQAMRVRTQIYSSRQVPTQLWSRSSRAWLKSHRTRLTSTPSAGGESSVDRPQYWPKPPEQVAGQRATCSSPPTYSLECHPPLQKVRRPPT